MCGDNLFPIYIWPHPGAPPLDQKPHQCPYFPHPLPQRGRVGHDIDRCIMVVVLCTCECVSVCVCVCVCVCYHASYYIPRLYVENKVTLSFLWCVVDMYCVDFFENALFRSSGNICYAPLPSSLLNELSMNKETVMASFQEN